MISSTCSIPMLSRIVSGLTPAGSFTQDLAIPIKQSSFEMAVPPFGQFPNTPGMNGGLDLGLAFLSDIQVFMFLEAAQGDARTNVMQAPKITVFNGQTATLTISDTQFFLTRIDVATAGAQLFFVPMQMPFPLGVTLATRGPLVSLTAAPAFTKPPETVTPASEARGVVLSRT